MAGFDKCAFENKAHMDEMKSKSKCLVDERVELDDEDEHNLNNKHHHKKDSCCSSHHHDHDDGCCCGHEHHHEHGDNCSCHHHEHEDGCSCHGHHHEHEDGCCCHEHDDGCCCCGHHHHHNDKKYKILLISRAIISFVLLIISIFIKNDIASNTLLIISYGVIAYDVLWSAIKNVLKGELFDENFLMTLASLTTLIVPIFNKEVLFDGNDGVLVILLYQIGEFIQHSAVEKSRDSISKMMDLHIDSVTKLIDDKEVQIGLDDIEVGDILLIKPGDEIPVDGLIISGSSTINTSSLTGESKPVEVYENDKVLSGCLNNDGVIKIKAITDSSNSTIAQVKEVIDQASKNKSNHEKFITRFARVYTPIVILISLFVMFIIPLILGFNEYFIEYLYKGLTVMVVSCPCALVISIPLSYFMGIGKCAKNAILVKGTTYLELLSQLDVIAFDKTGTITKGNFIVINEESSNQELMYELLYSCEKNLTHSIAKSITLYLKDKTKEVEIKNLNNIPGYGLKATYKDKIVYVGNKKLLDENNIAVDVIDKINTLVYVAYDNKYLGYIALSDEIKEDAKEALSLLNKKYDVHLISGDKKEIVEHVANELNINHAHYEVLPEQKLDIVTKLNSNKKLAYVGDGINDAACLIGSSVGIAMKNLGADIAIKASDIVIMDDKISTVNKAINISRHTMKIVKENIIFSIAVKVIIMLLAIIVGVPMYVAIIGDVGVCLLCVLNSLRILYRKKVSTNI